MFMIFFFENNMAHLCYFYDKSLVMLTLRDGSKT